MTQKETVKNANTRESEIFTGAKNPATLGSWLL
jgi:hypothetical protein